MIYYNSYLYSAPSLSFSDTFYHHGVKGMHWGVRRYQNPDGTLTSAGKKRYGTNIKMAGSGYKAYLKAEQKNKKAQRNLVEDYDKMSRDEYKKLIKPILDEKLPSYVKEDLVKSRDARTLSKEEIDTAKKAATTEIPDIVDWAVFDHVFDYGLEPSGFDTSSGQGEVALAKKLKTEYPEVYKTYLPYALSNLTEQELPAQSINEYLPRQYEDKLQAFRDKYSLNTYRYGSSTRFDAARSLIGRASTSDSYDYVEKHSAAIMAIEEVVDDNLKNKHWG